jgi:A/G-specific adenine glycosylase
MASRTPAPSTMPPRLRDAILAWYDASGRTLPFRASKDPYAVLVSEVMAQQTQISRVADAWKAFMAAFPTIRALAAASPADVLRAWRGMGYNRRALNLWRAARVIVEQHDGRLPSDVAALERLPGIGPYTARAVAAIAFGAAVGAVDTNVRRVLGRAVGGGDGALTANALQALADATVPADRPADWTHALMDVGATFCRPVRPRCGACPARPWCRYAASKRALGESDGSAPKPRGRATAVAFADSSRWLRGRILDRLREAGDAGWATFGHAIGVHELEAVDVALTTLAEEGLLELDPRDPRRARLPVD